VEFGFSDQASLQCVVVSPVYGPYAGSMDNEKKVEYQDSLSAYLNKSLAPFILCERYPKSVIDVCALILEDGGGTLCLTSESEIKKWLTICFAPV
jgi:ribonuclease PH